LTIETRAVTIDEDYCTHHAEFSPGEYVMLAVSDDGCGMQRETLEKIFDPFFTTKEIGRGTGLGLATVYGIVRQNDGLVNVYSEPGSGTSFRIYLPGQSGAVADAQKPEDRTTAKGHGETVLIVEDERAILNLVKRILTGLDYRILDAATPGRALELAKAHAGQLHLLITDVVMPGMNGHDLARQLRARHPGLRVLFMSGYTADAIAHRGVLDSGVHFIQKPFSRNDLAAKVRETLDSTEK
jgi:two-component system, cell cycle sensor histidine kinase and response regulator CckA